MGGLPFDTFRSTLNALAEGAPSEYRVVTVMDESDTWLGTWATDNSYVLVMASLANQGLNRTLIDVHAGAAYGAETKGGLFHALGTASWRFDFGGPWARTHQNGTTAYGWRSRLPSELFCQQNMQDAFGFVLGMVDSFGIASATLAEELIPKYGGRRCFDHDPNAWPALLSGVLPPNYN